MNPYPCYRNSGIEWLGEVPEHWEVRRLEHVAAYRTSNVNKKTEEGELPVRLCNYTDVYYGDRIRAGEGEFMAATASPGEVERFKLRTGDVLITKDSEDWRDIAVPALVDETADDFVCGYHLGIIRPGPAVDAVFLYRAMQSGAVNRQLQTSASGVTRYGLPNAAVGDALLPLPPLDEQRAIAAYLDRETERIDALVAKKRLLVERLEEYRTALITRTVTRGLPPEAARAAGLDLSPRLKPSGVEWLGEVPEHWEVGKVALAARRIQAGSTPPTANDEYYEDGTVPWFGPSAFRVSLVLGEPTKLLNEVAICNGVVRRFEAGTVMVVTIGATVGKVGLLATPASCNQQVTGITFNERMVIPTFAGLQLSLLGDLLKGIAPAATLPILSQSDIGHLAMLIPPLDEQRAIVAYLDDETELIDALVVRTEAATERLQEYRTALITAAVTGKIDVRESATGAPGLGGSPP